MLCTVRQTVPPEFKRSSVIAAIEARADNIVNVDGTSTAGRRLWTPGHTLGLVFVNGSSVLRGRIMLAARCWTEAANISFDRPARGAMPDIVVDFQPNECWSYIGTDCVGLAHGHNPTMNLPLTDYSSDGDICAYTLHQFGHALGMRHECSMQAAQIKWTAPMSVSVGETYEDVRRQFADVPERFLTKVVQDTPYRLYDLEPFDVQSVMNYPAPVGAAINYQMAWRSSLSRTDLHRAAMMYRSA